MRMAHGGGPARALHRVQASADPPVPGKGNGPVAFYSYGTARMVKWSLIPMYDGCIDTRMIYNSDHNCDYRPLSDKPAF